jgi:hypothetical protein
MILALLSLTLAGVAIGIFALIFEFLPEHLGAFLELALSGGATFAFVISPFFPGGFPSLESLRHTVD